MRTGVRAMESKVFGRGTGGHPGRPVSRIAGYPARRLPSAAGWPHIRPLP